MGKCMGQRNWEHNWSLGQGQNLSTSQRGRDTGALSGTWLDYSAPVILGDPLDLGRVVSMVKRPSTVPGTHGAFKQSLMN